MTDEPATPRSHRRSNRRRPVAGSRSGRWCSSSSPRSASRGRCTGAARAAGCRDRTAASTAEPLPDELGQPGGVQPGGGLVDEPGAASSAPAAISSSAADLGLRRHRDPDADARLPTPTAPPVVRPPVDVLNDSRIVGLAARAAKTLTAAGWKVDEDRQLRAHVGSTTVFYPAASCRPRNCWRASSRRSPTCCRRPEACRRPI